MCPRDGRLLYLPITHTHFDRGLCVWCTGKPGSTVLLSRSAGSLAWETGRGSKSGHLVGECHPGEHWGRGMPVTSVYMYTCTHVHTHTQVTTCKANARDSVPPVWVELGRVRQAHDREAWPHDDAASSHSTRLATNIDIGRSAVSQRAPPQGPDPTRPLLIWRISPEAACVPSSETGLREDGAEANLTGQAR